MNKRHAIQANNKLIVKFERNALWRHKDAKDFRYIEKDLKEV